MTTTDTTTTVAPGELRIMACQNCGETRWCGQVPDWSGVMCAECIADELDYIRQQYSPEDMGDLTGAETMRDALSHRPAAA